MAAIRRLTAQDLPRLRQVWKDKWGDEFMIVHGSMYRPDELEGFVAEEGEEWIGEITYRFDGSECEIISLDSQLEGKGTGTGLLEKVQEAARANGCRRVFLITTNDNLKALGFYQKRGFELVAVHRRAVDESRKLKPSIPLTGEHGIPLRDEIELELIL